MHVFEPDNSAEMHFDEYVVQIKIKGIHIIIYSNCYSVTTRSRYYVTLETIHGVLQCFSRDAELRNKVLPSLHKLSSKGVSWLSRQLSSLATSPRPQQMLPPNRLTLLEL